MSYEPGEHLWTPQRRGVLATIDALSRGKNVVLQAATGGGKTQMAIELFRWAQSQGMTGSFCVNRKLLVSQTSARFTSAGLPHAVRAAEYDDMYDPSQPFQVCSVDSEMARAYNPKRMVWSRFHAGLVVVDEAHIQKGQKMGAYLADQKARGARVVLLSATPVGLSSMADELVVSGTMSEYRACGALVPAVVKSISNPDMHKVKRNKTGEYVMGDRSRAIYTQTIVGDVLDRWKKYNPDARPTMLYAPGKAESVWFTQQFENIGVRFCHVDATEAYFDGKRHKLSRALWDEILQQYVDGSFAGISSRFKCLDLETEVLTKRGWIGHGGIRDCDLVASVDEITGAVTWDRPERIIRQTHDSGRFATLKSDSLDVRVTDDHTMLVRSADRRCQSWKREVASDVVLRRGAYQIPVAVNWIEAPGVDLTDHQISFLGWFLTDGHLRVDTGGVTISQSTSQPQHIHDHIVDSLNGCGLEWTSGKYEARIGDTQYADFIQYRVSRRQLFAAGLSTWLDKNFDLRLMDMTREQLHVLLKAVNYGDGSKRKNPSWTPKTLEITKGNKEFLSRLQAVCVSRGMRANLHDRSDAAWTLYVTPDRSHACVRGSSEPDVTENGHTRVKLRLKDSAPEDVWCLTTRHGTLITRRNGKVAVVGNCREGIDVPSTYCCILATPIGSLASYLQTVGRVLRNAPDKDSALVIDHGGNYLRHGSPNHDRPWSLWWTLPENAVSEMHTNQIRNGKEPEPIRCPKCEGERLGGSKCPHCGFEHQKSVRSVIMEDGTFETHEGRLIPKRRVKTTPDTEKDWAKMFWAFRRKKLDKSFAQLYAFFKHEKGYAPPRDMKFMPKTEHGWYQKVHLASFDELHGTRASGDAT